MPLRGIRGATVATTDQADDILDATRTLLEAIQTANPTLHTADLASAFFTVTEDLISTYPARAAREMGWVDVPMICSREIPVTGSLSRCIRVLLHWNTDLPQRAIRHIYLGAAVNLRPDLSVTDV